MEIIKRGAEAILYLDDYYGRSALVKERIKKGYRLKQLDEFIRKNRTKKEAKLLSESRKWGVPTPQVIDVTKNKIVMEFIEGKRIKEHLNSISQREVAKICEEIGRLIGILHSHNIIHGDLTTSNMILWKNKIYFIDFGLGKFSKRIEDKGVDLHLLYEALQSTHFKILELAWNSIVKGYEKEHPKADRALKKIEEIRKRRRYMHR